MNSSLARIRDVITTHARRHVATASAALLLLLSASTIAPVAARDLQCSACDVKDSEVARCLRIDPEASSTALLFNPAGKKTLFERSSCLQGLAVRYIDPALCAEVRERKSLFFDGSAISRDACLAQVREREHAREVVVIRDPYRPKQVDWFRDGNGRDTNVRIGFAGSYRHRYEVSVSMLDATGTRSEVLHRNEYGLGPHTRMLHIRITPDRIAAAADALDLAPPYRFRVTAALVDPTLAEVEQFAAMSPGEREHSVERVIDPATLEREPYDPPGR